MNPNFVHLRAFPTTLVRTGDRRLTGRLVPYNEIADVLDILEDGKPDVYREGFRSGAFATQANTKEKGVLNRISLRHRHEGDGLGYLGPFVGLREEPDGLWGDVQILRSRANDVEDLLNAGVDELSIEFRVPRGDNTSIDDNGVRWRTRAHLDGVALEPKGAYRSARVLQFRAEIDQEKAKEAQEAAEKAAAEAAEAEERQRAEQAAEEVRQRSEAEVEAAIERRRRFAEMVDRFDRTAAKQEELTREYLPGQVPGRGGLPRS